MAPGTERVEATPPKLTLSLIVPVRWKLESLQVAGPFKIRGAFFRLSRPFPYLVMLLLKTLLALSKV